MVGIVKVITKYISYQRQLTVQAGWSILFHLCDSGYISGQRTVLNATFCMTFIHCTIVLYNADHISGQIIMCPLVSTKLKLIGIQI